MKDNFVVSLVLVLVLLAGGAIGFLLANRHGTESAAPPTGDSASVRAGATVPSQPPSGTDGNYESVLRVYVALLDDLNARDSSASGRQIYAADKALSLIRLADLAEKRGLSADATRLSSDALAVCATSGLPYCSTAELHQRAKKLDEAFAKATQP